MAERGIKKRGFASVTIVTCAGCGCQNYVDPRLVGRIVCTGCDCILKAKSDG